MGMVGIESVLAAMAGKLQSGMTAKVAALNAEYTADDYTLAVIPAASYYSYVPDVMAPGFDPPACILIDDGHEAVTEQCNADLYVCRYRVVVDFLVRGEDAAELSALLRRYTRAAKEILVARHSLATTCTSCSWEATGSHRVTDPQSGDYLQDMASRFIVLTAETTS